ncbi:phosphotriesterase [Kibdelosporangium aridum]|uniref:Phosphotriesterase n=1 Tax=Kibdelosporangium aridum TaxID=2030 RepID=A0A428Z076_KIBAR|nr:phosphotriesterase [Kibdelosporangium aridum]RSM77324.1 phosphotriesterase [Kibdelosporangium aridum]
MSHVDTIRGPIPLAALGTVLMHEHVFVLSEDLRRARPDLYAEDTLVATAVEKLTALKSAGVDTIVDPTVLGLGRDVELVAKANAAVDINIVPATGLYTYHDVPFYLHYHGPGTMLGGPDILADLFVRDITEGISGTNIKAAFLKCAIQEELTPGVERVMVAVAEAHKQTGAPIVVHTSAPHGTGLVAQEVFRREGVDLGALVIGHSGDTEDLDYVRELIDGGSYIGMDRFGLDVMLSYEKRVAIVATLAAEGLSDRMMLSHDASCHIDWFPAGLRETVAPNWHYTFIHSTVIPALREAGVTDEQLKTMLVDNPRRYFAR